MNDMTLHQPQKAALATALRALWQGAHGAPAGAVYVLTGADGIAVLIKDVLSPAEPIKRLRDRGAQVRSAIRLGHPAGEILAAAREQDADLIVVGARGQTRAEPFRLGGVSQKVVKYAPCSALVVR